MTSPCHPSALPGLYSSWAALPPSLFPVTYAGVLGCQDHLEPEPQRIGAGTCLVRSPGEPKAEAETWVRVPRWGVGIGGRTWPCYPDGDVRTRRALVPARSFLREGNKASCAFLRADSRLSGCHVAPLPPKPQLCPKLVGRRGRAQQGTQQVPSWLPAPGLQRAAALCSVPSQRISQNRHERKRQ